MNTHIQTNTGESEWVTIAEVKMREKTQRKNLKLVDEEKYREQ